MRNSIRKGKVIFFISYCGFFRDSILFKYLKGIGKE